MQKVKKSAFVTAGQSACIGTVAIYAAYVFFPAIFWELLWRSLPIMCGLGALTYVFYKLDLEG